jgi:hypothetical protein
MASGAKQEMGGRVTGCALKLGEFVTRVILYVTTLGSYDVVIGKVGWKCMRRFSTLRQND